MKTFDRPRHDKSLSNPVQARRTSRGSHHSGDGPRANNLPESPKERSLTVIEERANYRANQPKQASDVSGGAVVMQLLLNRDLTTDHALQVLIDRFNQEYETYLKKSESWLSGTEPERRAALKTLHNIELAIYEYFGAQDVEDLDVDPANIKMKSLMNAVQEERRNLVGLSLEKVIKDKAPPVANYDELLPIEQEKVTLIWKSLVADKGIRIIGDKAFRYNVLADFARLIENRFGRDLVHRIVTEKDALVIEPTTLEGGKFVASPLAPELEGFTLLPEAPADPENYLLIDPAVQSESYKLSVFRKVRLNVPDMKGIALSLSGRVEYYRFGKGSPSGLPIPKDARDALPHMSSRLLGAGNREVIAPTFVILAHELGHVLRSLLGISAGQAGQQFIQSAFSGVQGVERPEEFFNIKDIENAVRAENRISPREGHGNLYMQVASKLFEKMESWRRYIDIFKSKEYPTSLNDKSSQLDEAVLEIQLDLQKILESRGGSLAPVYTKFSEANRIAGELQDVFLASIVTHELPHLDVSTRSFSETTPSDVDGHVETVRGKGYDRSITDLYLAIKEIAIDHGLGEYTTELQKAFKEGQPFVSEQAMANVFKAVLPPNRSSVAKRIAEYLVENSA